MTKWLKKSLLALAAAAFIPLGVFAQVQISSPGGGVIANACAGGQYASAISATGGLTCSTPSGSGAGITGSPATPEIAYWASGTALTGAAGITFDGTSIAIPDPTTLTEAATKNYVDTAISAVNVGGATANSFLISGGQVTWASSLNFTVSNASYYLIGTLYSSTQQTVTLATADPTNPRIDLIILDNTGTASAITGTPASTPSEPSYDPSTQLPLTVVSVPANATVPPSVVTTLLYQNDAGASAEWNWSASGTGIVVNSTNNPLSPGTHTIEATNMATNATATGQIGTGSFDPNTANFYIFWIRSKAAWAAKRTLVVSFLSSGVVKGNPITISTGAYGFNSATTASYQQVAIPVSQFAIPSGTTINQVQFQDKGGAIGFYIGLVEFQGGVTGSATQGITQAQADARYAQLNQPFVITTSQTNLPNASNIGALSSGLLLNTVSGGAATVSKYAGTSCTNQATTALSASGAATCTTLTSAYVNNSIALTGADINTSNQVTVTHLAAALPVAQGGTGGGTASITLFNNITGFTAAGTVGGATSTDLVFAGTSNADSSHWLRGDGTWTTVAAAPSGSSADVQCNVSSALAACDTGIFTYSSHTLTVGSGGVTTPNPAGGTGGAAGNNLVLLASNATVGSGAGANAGGNVNVTAGNANGQTSGTAIGGVVNILAGNGYAPGSSSLPNGGAVNITGGLPGGNSSATAVGGAVNITGGSGTNAGLSLGGGGAVVLTGGAGIGTGGAVTITGGANVGGTTTGGNVTITSGASGGGPGSSVNLLSASASGTSVNIGAVNITVGNFTGSSGSSTIAGLVLTGGSATTSNGGSAGITGGLISLTAGAGQPASFSTAGPGGAITLTTGAGGAESAAATAGGAGGLLTLAGGVGGVSNGASGTRNGGAGGTIVLAPGAGGVGTTANGQPGMIQLQGLEEATGAGPTLSGCSFSTQVGGTMAGSYHSGTTGSCAVTLTFATTAAHGFSCWAADTTTTTDTVFETSFSTTTAVLTGVTASGDVIVWGCRAF